MMKRLFELPVGTTPSDAVLSENKYRLLRYRPRAEGIAHATPIVIVPSLINRHYVLDLLPGKSFVEELVRRGHDVYMMHWGTPGAEDRFLTFDTITDRYLGRAINKAASIARTDRVHLLGYCLGGTLTAIHAAARPEKIQTLTAIAAPIDFDDGGLLSAWTKTRSFDVGALLDAFGLVPWPLMQASFHLLKPTLNLLKGVQLIEKLADDEFLDRFFALETWGNDNVSLPGEFYRTYIEQLYRKNALVRDEFSLSGRPVRLSAIRCPTLAITFEHDHIVPPAGAAVLLDRISSQDKQRIHVNGGHVGAVVSKKGAETLWPAIAQFFREHEAESTGSRADESIRARRPFADLRAEDRREQHVDPRGDRRLRD